MENAYGREKSKEAIKERRRRKKRREGERRLFTGGLEQQTSKGREEVEEVLLSMTFPFPSFLHPYLNTNLLTHQTRGRRRGGKRQADKRE